VRRLRVNRGLLQRLSIPRGGPEAAPPASPAWTPTPPRAVAPPPAPLVAADDALPAGSYLSAGDQFLCIGGAFLVAEGAG
jgi:hypothetical protein